MNSRSEEIISRAPDKDRFLLSRMAISAPNPMFDHSLESSHRDDSNKWSNIGFGEEIQQVESNEADLTNLIWSSAYQCLCFLVLNKSQLSNFKVHVCFNISLLRSHEMPFY